MKKLFVVPMVLVMIQAAFATNMRFEGTNTYVAQDERCEDLPEDIVNETLIQAQEQAQIKADQFCGTNEKAVRNSEFEIKSECRYKRIPFGQLTYLTKTASAEFECR